MSLINKGAYGLNIQTLLLQPRDVFVFWFNKPEVWGELRRIRKGNLFASLSRATEGIMAISNKDEKLWDYWNTKYIRNVYEKVDDVRYVTYYYAKDYKGNNDYIMRTDLVLSPLIRALYEDTK